jgi:hypothetical protein
MGKKRGQMDVLDLPPDERARICREIRAALEERVSAMKIPLSSDVIVADKKMLASLEAKHKDEQCSSSSLLSVVVKRVW